MLDKVWRTLAAQAAARPAACYAVSFALFVALITLDHL